MQSQNAAPTAEPRSQTGLPFWFQALLITLGLTFLLLLLSAVVVLPSLVDFWIASKQATVPTTPTGATSNAGDASKHFEALARYVTLVITVASIGVAFFGYLLRKNIREVEEDLHRRFEREAAEWDSEREGLKERFDKDYEELKSALDELPALRKKFEEFESLAYEKLASLDAANAEFSDASARDGSDVERAAAEIDATFTEPNNTGDVEG